MAKDAIFYPDPQPFEPTNKLPPSAFVTGSQPPRIGTQAALTAAMIAMSWPQPNAPQLHQQNLAPRKMAPLTLVYGQQPPPRGPLDIEDLTTVRRTWPEDNEPRLSKQQTSAVRIVPPANGQNPPLQGPITPAELRLIIDTWKESAPLPQFGVDSAAWDVPVTVSGFTPFTRQWQNILAAWNYDPTTVITMADGSPLFPVQGEEPPRDAPARDPQLQAFIASQFVVDWSAQRAPDLTPPSVDVTAITGAITPIELALIVASWAPAPPQPQSSQRLTPSSGFTQPPPAVRRHLELIASAWAEIDRPPLRRIVSAAWDYPVAVVNDPPRYRFPSSIRAAWEVEPRAIARRVTAAPWDIAVINNPPPLKRFPNSVLLAWQPEFTLVRPVRIAPLIAIAQTLYVIWGTATDLTAVVASSDLSASIEAKDLNTDSDAEEFRG